jgi:hypothetical protein
MRELQFPGNAIGGLANPLPKMLGFGAHDVNITRGPRCVEHASQQAGGTSDDVQGHIAAQVVEMFAGSAKGFLELSGSQRHLIT